MGINAYEIAFGTDWPLRGKRLPAPTPCKLQLSTVFLGAQIAS
jgi:hypothetical protein